MPQTLTYTVAQRAVADAHDDMAQMRERHAREKEQVQRNIDDAVADLRHLQSGTQPDTRELAESIIQIRGATRWADGEGPSARQDAIRDILDGGGKLRREYFGTKQYEGWVGQRCDTEYNFGPKHGRIIFAIEMTPETRKRLNGDGPPLNAEETEAVVQLLTNLPAYVENGGR